MQALHMLCPHSRCVVLEMGSSQRQVRHSTRFSGLGGGGLGLETPKREPIMLAGRSLLLTDVARAILGSIGSTFNGALGIDDRGAEEDMVCRVAAVVLLRVRGGRRLEERGSSRALELLNMN